MISDVILEEGDRKDYPFWHSWLYLRMNCVNVTFQSFIPFIFLTTLWAYLIFTMIPIHVSLQVCHTSPTFRAQFLIFWNWLLIMFSCFLFWHLRDPQTLFAPIVLFFCLIINLFASSFTTIRFFFFFKGSFFSKGFVKISTFSNFSSIFPLKIWRSLYFENSRLFQSRKKTVSLVLIIGFLSSSPL